MITLPVMVSLPASLAEERVRLILRSHGALENQLPSCHIPVQMHCSETMKRDTLLALLNITGSICSVTGFSIIALQKATGLTLQSIILTLCLSALGLGVVSVYAGFSHQLILDRLSRAPMWIVVAAYSFAFSLFFGGVWLGLWFFLGR